MTLIHAYSYFSSLPALSLRSFLLSFNFPHMLLITLARCAVYPSLVHFPLPLPWPSRLVFVRIPFPFGNFLGFSCSSFGALALSGLSSTSCYCLFSCRVFCITCASFWFSGFPGIPSGVFRSLSALVYLFPAFHFYPLSCSPLGSFPHLSSSSTPFRVFFCLPRLPGGFALALLSYHQFFCVFSLPLSLLLVRLLALGAFVLLIFLLFPTLFPGCTCCSFAGLASFHLPLPPSHLSFVSCHSLYGS